MTMKRSLLLAAAAALFLAAGPVLAADDYSAPATQKDAIKGTMQIDFGTRTNLAADGKSPAPGATDAYKTDVEVMNSVIFQGAITRQPWLPTKILGRTAQDGFLQYDLALILRNPKNPSQTVTLGKWAGAMSLDGSGKYSLAQAPEGKGALRIATDAVGKIPGFTSNFGGEMQGRVPEQAGIWGLADRASKKINKSYVRLVGGKLIKQVVNGADPMEFQQVDLAEGPLAQYPETKFTGSIDYDAENSNWYIDATASYNLNGAVVNDRYSGTIRWSEDPDRKANGKGKYEVNVRLNEKPASESDAFTANDQSSEDAFFSADATVPGFTGTIAYVDRFVPGSQQTTIASQVAYNVDANQASKIQAMDFAKILMLIVGPFNDD
jgi:hypothetical protein